MAHVPVLLKEIIQVLDPRPGEFFIDGTIGNAGHGLEIYKKIIPNGKLLGIDWDKKNIELIKINFEDSPNVFLMNANYTELPKILEESNFGKADGLILDLGFSSDQLESGKGFSFKRDEPLDMRYNGEGMTAAEVVNSFRKEELADIFYKYGEEKYSRKIAENIFKERKNKRIISTSELVQIIKSSVPENYEGGRIHPATRVFQALRIYVNEELDNLEIILKNLENILTVKGRVAIVAFHSLEDRLVKNYFRDLERNGKGKILTKKPIISTEEEANNNPKSRSAKLRAFQFN